LGCYREVIGGEVMGGEVMGNHTLTILS